MNQTFPVVENWRSIVERGEGLTADQARCMLADLEWAMKVASDANALAARIAGPSPAQHMEQWRAPGWNIG